MNRKEWRAAQKDRHNGVFALLSSEDPNGFEALKASLTEEHQPSTETESY